MKIIILNITQYKESDIIINAISEEGPVSFKVRGAAKQNSAFAWLNNRLVIADVEYVENIRYIHQILKNAKLITFPISDEFKYENIMAINLANEAMERLLQDEEKHLMFKYLEGYVNYVKKAKDPILGVLIFLGKILKVAGYELEVNKCIYCGSTKNIKAFSFAEGGFICGDCLSEEIMYDLTTDQMKLVRAVLNRENYDNLQAADVSDIDKKVLLTKFRDFIKDGLGVELGSINLILKN